MYVNQIPYRRSVARKPSHYRVRRINASPRTCVNTYLGGWVAYASLSPNGWSHRKTVKAMPFIYLDLQRYTFSQCVRLGSMVSLVVIHIRSVVTSL